jgi:basic membrane protein A
MFNKKRLVLMLVLVLAISTILTGCGAKPAPADSAKPAEQPKDAPKTLKVGSMFSVPDPANGGGWDRAHYQGLMTLKEKYGWEVSVAENVPYPKISETALNYLDKGYDMIIYPDNGMIESWKELAPQFQDKWMLMTSAVDALPDSPKVAAYAPNFYEYGNMVGIAAAKASKTGKIGLLGGSPIPVLESLFSGIIEGAKAVNPNAEVVVYWAGDWVDTAKHREITLLEIQEGADVIFTVTGPAAKGVYEAAESKNAKVIGYCWDLYNDNPKAIMTSLMLDTPKMYDEIGKDFQDGTLEKKVYDLGSKYFNFADFRGSVPADVEKDIKDTVEKFKNGELKIPVVIHEEIMK